jgi:hypothetical protein
MCARRGPFYRDLCARGGNAALRRDREGFLSKLQSTARVRASGDKREAFLIYHWERWPRSFESVCVRSHEVLLIR